MAVIAEGIGQTEEGRRGQAKAGAFGRIDGHPEEPPDDLRHDGERDRDEEKSRKIAAPEIKPVQ